MPSDSSFPPIASVLPHEPPLVLLDEIVDLDEERIEAKVTIASDSMFLRDGKVRGIVCLEYMAQAVAAFAGIRRQSAGEAPKIGYIIGVPSMELEVDNFKIGDELQVHAKHIWGEGELGRFDCRVERGQKQVARASLSVYSGDIET
jgi:predicted hotdog family 3-hydroxylacyl-ACP dehydratase